MAKLTPNNNQHHIMELRDIVKQYDGNTVLKGISFNVFKGEFFTIVGPSGCGKTTTLRIINGTESPEQGMIIMDQKVINKLRSYERNINTIFQDYALFDHLNVFNNIAYGPKMKHIKSKVYTPIVEHYLKLVNLEKYGKKKIHELSGGQKQRVAIARALINEPGILLLDEPMSALDPALRSKMQQQLKQIQSRINITFILITHDQDEALMLSDRIMVMNDGKIMQIGTPEEVYNEPDSKWVAQFIGASNIIENGIFVHNNLVQFDNQDFVCLDTNFGENEQRIDILIRPEDIFITSENQGFMNGQVLNSKFRGVHWNIKVKTQSRIFQVNSIDYQESGSHVALKWNKEALHVMWKEIDD